MEQSVREIKIAPDTFIKVSLGAVVFSITVVFGFAGWMTAQEVRGSALSSEVESLKDGQATQVLLLRDWKDSQVELLHRMDIRLERIENKIMGN
jgi:hypothetical protein